MTDKEKILNEIKRRLRDNTLSYQKDKRPQFNKLGRIMEDEDLLSFIDSLQEEPVSEDLEEAAEEYCDTHYIDACVEIPAFKAGAKWQEKQDQSTIELAEDHAMLAGMEKMKEEMMAKAVETTFNVSLPSGLYDKLWIKGCKEGDKLLVIKKDEL